jgi:hypothetical protein
MLHKMNEGGWMQMQMQKKRERKRERERDRERERERERERRHHMIHSTGACCVPLPIHK